jgi:Flp pilus assembly protein TadG
MRRIQRSDVARRGDSGFIITLVAVFLLFVVGAMAALSIDVVTFYTARSEAQLAADAAALAGARVLANSGATSWSNSDMLTRAQDSAKQLAQRVAESNSVAGQPVAAVNVWFNGQGNSPCSLGLVVSNPCVTVTINTTVPVFFARIWGSTQVTIFATATAEAFNPSGLASGTSTGEYVPIGPSCVKPLLIPNLDPNPAYPGNPIFDTATGAIKDVNLLGMQFPNSSNTTPGLYAACGPNGTASCSAAGATPKTWQYFVGDQLKSFPAPAKALPSCTVNPFQAGIAGCVETPIVCGAPPASQVYLDTTSDGTLDQQAAAAVDCLTHTSNGTGGDTMSPSLQPPAAFEFTAGAENPLVVAGTLLVSDSQIFVSDSLVTVPVFDSSLGTVSSGNPVTVIGFLQLFLQPAGTSVESGGSSPLQIQSEIVNMVGCGTNANGNPVYGNGATAVPVRLITPP